MDGPGILKASFIYADEAAGHALSSFCPPAPAASGAIAPTVTPGGLAVDVAAKFLEVGVASLIDAASMRMRPKSTTLDTVIPIDGFLRGDCSPAIEHATLVLHNGSDSAATDASFVLSLSVIVSADKSAFKFRVFNWKMLRFLRPRTNQWFQKETERDWIIRIEFLTPGSAGLGVQSSFIEQAFHAITLHDLQQAFLPGRELPWLRMPDTPAVLIGSQQPASALFLPANVHITVVETTEPNQFALWLADSFSSTKSNLATAASGEVRYFLSNFGKSGDLNSLEYSSAAFLTYKTSWEKLRTLRATEPTAPPNDAQQSLRDQFEVNHSSWIASVTIQSEEMEINRKIAINAFQKAGLIWPGDFPVWPHV